MCLFLGKAGEIQPLMVSFKKYFFPWLNTPSKASFTTYKMQELLLWQIPGPAVKQEALGWREGKRADTDDVTLYPYHLFIDLETQACLSFSLSKLFFI